MQRIGVLTGGGDAPGMNNVLKAIVYRANEARIGVLGIYDGWEGLLGDEKPETVELSPAMVRTWDRDGGTHLGSSRTNPFRVARGSAKRDASDEVVRNVERLRLDALIAVGGCDALGVAQRLAAKGLPIVAVPKSINKEVGATDYSLGFDTSMRTCADIIERSRTPAGSQRWVQVVEVFGHAAGHLALWSGLAGGAQVILIPEHRFTLERLYQRIEERLGVGPARGVRSPRYATVVVSEGAAPEGGREITVGTSVDDFGHARLGGIGALLAERIREDTPNDARVVSLGHPQRGGVPSSVDRIMGHLFGSAAVEACLLKRFGTMVSAQGLVPAARVTLVELGTALAMPARVDVEQHYDTERYFAKRSVLRLSAG
jgi:6-phosphofructokinase 1